MRFVHASGRRAGVMRDSRCRTTFTCRRAIRFRNLIVAGLTLTAVTGCSRSIEATPAEVFPASGTLAYHGTPVALAQLTFWSDELSEPAFALTDALGKFKCMTNETGEGMPPGEYLVTVSNSSVKIPDKYADVDSSPLRVTVAAEAANEFVLELID
jgi:hypothetical protein